MKLWIDDVRPAPKGYVWCKSVNEAIAVIITSEGRNGNTTPVTELFPEMNWAIELIDIDHDAGDYASDGGDYIKLLDWLEETGRNYPIQIHSMIPVGVANMRQIIEKNGWVEVSCSTCRFKNYQPYDEICVRCENCNGWTEAR